MQLHELRHACEVHVQVVLCGQREQGSRIWWASRNRVHKRLEEILEAGGCDDLQQPGWFVARVPERVPLIARLEDQVTGLAVDDLPTEVGSDTPFEYVAVFVLSVVAMQRSSQRPGWHRMLDEREPAAGFRTANHQPSADATEASRLAVLRTNDA